jgi:hypothetical protein
MTMESTLEIAGRLDRRAIEALYIEIRARALARGFDVELVAVERCASPRPVVAPAQSGGGAMSSVASTDRA